MIERKNAKIEEEKEIPKLPFSFYSIDWNRTGAWRHIRPKFSEKLAPCRESCPAGEDIEGYMRLVANGDFIHAWNLIREENPLPAVCGRICYHPCENGCNRRRFDRPVSINAIERFVSDYVWSKPGKFKVEKLPRRKEKIAVVGSGPAGLTCAYHLAKRGYGVTVYEALSEPGGMLSVGIPEYRLPKEILKWEIDNIIKLGIEVKSNTYIGKDISLEELKNKNNAVFLATGAYKSRSLKISGENAKGVYKGLEFLKSINGGRKIDIGKRVAVIGGGNTAIDVARSAVRFKSDVTVFYRRTRAEMGAYPDEVLDAEREGAEVKLLTSPVKIIENKDNNLCVEFVRMRLGDVDSSGRRRPVAIKGSNFKTDVENVIIAVGEDSDLSYISDNIETNNGFIMTDPTGATSLKSVFAGGDATDQPRTVVDAISSGKKAALAIDHCLNKRDSFKALADLKLGERGGVTLNNNIYTKNKNELSKIREVVAFEDINLDYFESHERGRRPVLGLQERISDFKEVMLGLSSKTALWDASRCFNCGTCTKCDNCYIYCPDISVLKNVTEFGYEFDYEHCKGCGICAVECPRHVISMEEERNR